MEAPSGFEPEMEVLQTKNADRASDEIADLLSKSGDSCCPPLAGIWPSGLPTVTISVTVPICSPSTVSGACETGLSRPILNFLRAA
jgi:hypothetical protein